MSVGQVWASSKEYSLSQVSNRCRYASAGD